MPEQVQKGNKKLPNEWKSPKSLAFYHIRYYPIYYRLYYSY
jgi:hypothetical protein